MMAGRIGLTASSAANVYVPNWSLAVPGNIQPRRLAAMAPTLVDDGLFQRFLTIHTQPPVLGRDDDRPAREAARKDYRDLHATLAQLAPVTADKPLPCYFDADARAERQRFMRLVERLQVDPSLPTIIRETAPKWSGLLAGWPWSSTPSSWSSSATAARHPRLRTSAG